MKPQKDAPSAQAEAPVAPKGKHFFGSVKMGEKGQIVIPKSARDLFGLKPGSSLLVVGDEDSGIALITDKAISELIQMAALGYKAPKNSEDEI